MPVPSPISALLNEALNHVLRQQAWARERLAPFAGETVELRGGLLPALRFGINEQGFLEKPQAQDEPSLVVTLKPEAAAALARGEDHLLRAVEVAGNAK